jgi:hypothetical protein
MLFTLLKAALPAQRINVSKVQRILKLAQAQGYNPVSMYRRACEGRPDHWEKPPSIGVLMHGKPQKAPEDLPEAKKRADELGPKAQPKKPEEESTQ